MVKSTNIKLTAISLSPIVISIFLIFKLVKKLEKTIICRVLILLIYQNLFKRVQIVYVQQKHMWVKKNNIMNFLNKNNNHKKQQNFTKFIKK